MCSLRKLYCFDENTDPFAVFDNQNMDFAEYKTDTKQNFWKLKPSYHYTSIRHCTECHIGILDPSIHSFLVCYTELLQFKVNQNYRRELVSSVTNVLSFRMESNSEVLNRIVFVVHKSQH